jgi:hypothetical protein
LTELTMRSLKSLADLSQSPFDPGDGLVFDSSPAVALIDFASIEQSVVDHSVPAEPDGHSPADASRDAAVIGGQQGLDLDISAPQEASADQGVADAFPDDAASEDVGGMLMTMMPSSSMPAAIASPAVVPVAVAFDHAAIGVSSAGEAIAFAGSQMLYGSLNAAMPAVTVAICHDPAATAAAPVALAHLENPAQGSFDATIDASVGTQGATAAQVQQALDEHGLSVNGTGIKVGVLSDSFNDLGGAAADEADGALPSASNIQVLEDLSSGGTDEGRAMMQIVHDIAPGASLAFYTAFNSEQDFANGILALAAAGCKVICDDVSYFDEPFFQNGIVAQAIQTVEAEGVTYVTSAGNDASNAYQAAWTPGSGYFDGIYFTDAELFGGSLAQTITVGGASTKDPVPLLLEWNLPYGQASFASLQAPDIDIFVYQNGSLIAQATNATAGEPNNPWTGYEFTASGTYQIVISNNFGPDPGLIKEIVAGDGLPVTISGANAGTVYGHAMTPGVITAGAVSAADTPAFGVSSPSSEFFSSSGLGTELLFANNGTALLSPDQLSPVAVSGIDDIATTVPGGLSDFYGTSAASASLAGVAALLLSENPNLTPAQVEQVMEETALPMSNSAVSGSGLVQVDAAIAALPPSLVADASLTVPLDGSGVITSSLLKFDDAFSSDAQETYTVITAPAQGTLLKNGSATSTFTQADIDNGLISYRENGSTAMTDSFTFKVTDAAGNATTAQQFQIDMSKTIESFGSTSLVQIGNDFFLDGGGTDPELQYGGAAWVAGEWGTWAPIGAEKTATGYEVAFKIAGANIYTVWDTDLNGNITTDPIGTVAGNSTALETLESSFQQDLNGDGVIGVPAGPPVTIESFGSTSLVQTGSDFFLDSTISGTGPELKYGGAPWVAGEWGAWTPIGTEATATGYEVAFKLAGANLYTVWNTDNSGNIASDTIGTVAGNSTALELLEPSFHQDINNDGTIGIPGSTIIETSGATSLVETGNNFFMYANSSGTGPELKYGGAAFAAGQWGGWTPIGAEATSTGYEVAFKFASANLYTVWDTDQSGNITVDPIGTVAASSTALESLEPSFQQDLNGDGVIGIPASTSAGASVAAAAATIANNDMFVFAPATGTAATGGSANAVGYDAIAAASGNPPAESLHDAASSQWANDGHGSALDHGGAHVHWLDTHASGFMIH